MRKTAVKSYQEMIEFDLANISMELWGKLWLHHFHHMEIIAIYEAAVKRRGFYLCRDKFYWCREAFMDVERQFNAVVLPRDVHKGLETPVKSCRGRG